ncbi:MAG: restriction endonuclease [Planctomycetota bacterium]|nr:restriction endonuclease [Planctomycetota bacterium]
MSIPDFQSFLLPALETAGRGSASVKETVKTMASRFALTAADLATLLPSGHHTVVASRAAWALYYLAKAGLVKGESRGVYSITMTGQTLLNRRRERLSVRDLYRESEDFAAWHASRRSADGWERAKGASDEEDNDDEPPEEVMARAYRQLRDMLRDELLERIDRLDAGGFETLIVRLMGQLGYGNGGFSGQTIAGGVNGVVYQDRLKLDCVHIQAWPDGRVGRVDPPRIQGFLGLMDSEGVGKGVFITTGGFSLEAKRTARQSQKHVVLVDRTELGELMIENDIGVQPDAGRIYELKSLDNDFFDEL